MTFDKYNQGREKFNDCIYPDKKYDYKYVWTKALGWHIVRGKKLPEFIPGSTWKNDFNIDKEIIKRRQKK